jgi:hypothetical protein
LYVLHWTRRVRALGDYCFGDASAGMAMGRSVGEVDVVFPFWSCCEVQPLVKMIDLEGEMMTDGIG